MPLPKSAHQLTAPRKVLLTANGISELARIHRDAVFRELARGTIHADSWLDGRGRLFPLFLPTVAVELARILPAHDPILPAIS
jgi:hypothetical protein